MINNALKSFEILAINLSAFNNYFNDPTKLFSDLYTVKFMSNYIQFELFIIDKLKSFL